MSSNRPGRDRRQATLRTPAGPSGRLDRRRGRAVAARQRVQQPSSRPPPAWIRDHQQPPAGDERPPLGGRVRPLDAGPRLEQGHGRARRYLIDRDQEPLARPGVQDHPLVEEDVLLQPALEVVPEGRIGAGRGQVAVVGLDQDALADAVPRHGVAHRDDPGGDLVAGDRGRSPGM